MKKKGRAVIYVDMVLCEGRGGHAKIGNGSREERRKKLGINNQM